MEEWREIDGYPYEVSNSGRVRRITPACGTSPGRFVKPYLVNKKFPTKSRYMVQLSQHGSRKKVLLNRLVCKVFHGFPPSADHEAAHNDGNGLNNVASNLRWATRAENHSDRIKHGTHFRGDRSPKSKLNSVIVGYIRELVSNGFKQTDMAKAFGVSKTNINYIIKRKAWAYCDQELG